MSANEMTLTRDQTLKLVLERLKDAAAAHGVHEATVLEGRYDDEWPEWYSDHIVAALTQAGYKIVGPQSQPLGIHNAEHPAATPITDRKRK